MEMQKRQQTPEQDALEHIAACRDKPFLEERFIDSLKGRGVFTQQIIEPSSFVVEYRGKIFGHKTTRPRRKRGDTLNNYLYEFSWKGAHWCIDASKEDKTLGRLVNDDHTNPNCEMKKIELEGTPHLCLFAIKEISPGEEITYNYGDSSYLWRSRLEAAACPEESCSGDDELPDSDPKSKRDSNGEHDPDEAPASSDEHGSGSDCEPDEAPASSDEHGSGSDCLANKDTEKPKPTSHSRRSRYVCGKGMAKISRHLLTHSDEELNIAKAFALPETSKERKRLLRGLRNRDDQGLTKSGDSTPKRQTKKKAADGETHVETCNKKMSNSATRGRTKALQETDPAEAPLFEKLPSDLQKMILSMTKDEKTFMIKHDPLLIQLAQCLSEKYAHSTKKHEYIRQQLRRMARFLLALHGKSIFSFEDVLKPQNFGKVVETVKGFARFNERRQRYENPRVALTLGRTLKIIARTVVSKAADNEEMVRDTKAFITLCEEEWKGLESHQEDPLLSRQNPKSPSTIPFTHDVQALYRCLETTSASAIETMNKYESPQVYNSLCRVILAQALILNKGAPEVSKMTLKSFQEREDTTQVLSKHFIRINIPSKTGKNVAVLLTSELVSAITLLVSKRASCGVHTDNVFLFANPDGSASSVQRGQDCIKVFSNLCHAKSPEYLGTSHFQKHIARVFQILNLENDELRHLAKLLGHDIRTEKDYYRLPEAAVELAKIAKLLLAMEKGSLERFKGNSLEEIEIEDQLEPDVEKANSKICDAEEDYEKSAPLPHVSGDAGQDSRLTPEQDALNHIKACRDKAFLEGMFIDPFKGRGVFTHESIEPSTFVVEYRGNICTRSETWKNKGGDTVNDYLFDFSWNGTNWRTDASADDGTLGRLVNDNHISPNCEVRKVACEGKPHLCLFALKKIFAGEEITYNYGDSSYPWRSTESGEKHKTSHTDVNAAASSPRKERVGGSSSAESCCDGPDDGPDDDDDDPGNSNQECRGPGCAESQSSKLHLADDEQERGARSAESHSYTNRNYCYVCGKAQTKISRHLFTHKKKDPEIAAVFALRRNSKERKSQLKKLQDRGNWKHNQEVLKTRCGELKVRRKSFSTSGKTFVPCLYCKNIYGHKDMWQHLRKCRLKESSNLSADVSNKILIWVAGTAIGPVAEMPSNVRELAKTLKEDESAADIWKDSYILQLAQYLCHNNEGKTKHFQCTRQKLRQMGRLLVLLNKKSVCSFEDAMKPQNFSVLAEAVGELIGLGGDRRSYDTPKFVKLVGTLKLIANIKYARALKEDADQETIQEAETFMARCAQEWTPTPLSKLKMDNAKTIPFTHDVQLFYQLIEKTAASGVASLTMYESPQVYNALARVTFAQISVLNKNGSNISTVTLRSFNERQDAELPEDAALCQSPLEQILFKRFVKIQVRSRSGKKVPVMLTPEMLSAVTLLVNKREACGIHKNNSFLFARPGATPSSFYRGQTCINTLVSWSGAKNLQKLRSPFFRKHMAKIFHILSLSSDELDQLSKLLRCDIRTDRDYYQTPDAAVDIAKILQLISAVDKGSTEEFDEKSLDELELEDELQPDMEQNSPDSSDGEEGSIGDHSCPQARELISSRNGQESVREESERSDKKNDGLNTEEVRVTENKPVKFDQETANGKGDAANVWYSDDDDMNVDFDIDIDTDEDAKYEEYDRDGDSTSFAATPTSTDIREPKNKDISKDGSPDEHGSDHDETMDTDTDHVDKTDQETEVEQTDWMDVDSRRSSAILNAEKTNKLLAALTGMKEVKILIPKLEIDNFEEPILMSQLSSLHSKRPVKDRLAQHSDERRRSSTSTDVDNKPGDAKDIEMTCSRCKNSMMKGQTAYQKKGFTEVFCSKNCLFEMFPISKPAAKTCHYCHREITHMLDLVMAVVDIKGTMKDFCSVTCLTSFKSTPVTTPTLPSLCSMCNKSCITTCELTFNHAIHKFCSNSCLEGFRKSNIDVCENCNSPCPQKLMVKLGEDTKTTCSEGCVQKLKEKLKTPHSCTMCHTSVPMSRMIACKTSKDTVELFCDRPCVTSYKLGSAVIHKLQGKMDWKKDEQSKQNSNTPDVNVSSDSTVKVKDATSAAESDFMPAFITAELCVPCFTCGKKIQKGQTVYEVKSLKEVYCSAPCFSEQRFHITGIPKHCYKCLGLIKRPQNIILAPVDDSGTMRELCSQTCLASIQSKRNTAPKPPTPSHGLRSECRMCVRFCHCKFKLTVKGRIYSFCSNSCLLNYHKLVNKPLLTCDVCSSVSLERRLELKMEDGIKNICSDECLGKFKEKAKTRQLCPMCQTLHQMSDMVEKENESGSLTFFCSSRCMMVYRAPPFTVLEESKPSPQVKPALPNVNCSKVKEEPMDDEYTEDFLPSVSTQGIKDEPNVTKQDLKIGLALSLKTPPEESTVTHMDLPASCSGCKEVLLNGETVYQRKGRAEIFCSTSCLLKFYRMKPVRICHFCLQVITRPQEAVQAQLDEGGTVKDFCSQACLSSFNYKTYVSTKIAIMAVGAHSQCSICGRYCISKHEVLQQDVVQKMCSDSCFRRFCNMNKLSVCENCQSHCSTPLIMKMDHSHRKLCSAECLAQFKEKIQTEAPCSMCLSAKPVSDMVEKKTGDNTVELFCSSSCVMTSKLIKASESSSPDPSATADSSPVITNVMSLARALDRSPRASTSTAQRGSLPDIQSKVVGHACVQTTAKEVKNKSMLCTPLVHNKGVSCVTQTVNAETQTDNFVPRVVVLPLPVPVYVPLPMNMYSQYTPKPVGLPLPLPVPMFLSVPSNGPEPTVETMNEKIQPETLEEKPASQMETKQNDRKEREDGQKDREVIKEEGQETQTLTDHTRSCCHDVNKDSLDSSSVQEGSSSDASLRVHSGPHIHGKPPPASCSCVPSEAKLPTPRSSRSQSSRRPASLPPLQQSLGKVHNKNKGRKLQRSSEAAKEDTAPHRPVSKVTCRKHDRLKSHHGIDAWRRWVLSQTTVGRGSEPAVVLKENILDCSASELSDGLRRFIGEVKRPDGERYSPSSVFYLCLAIQQYLFENGRTENIFSDQIYSKFSTKFTEILKCYQPAVTASGYIQSQVDEEYLWDCKQLGAYSPIVLLNTLLFFTCKYFGLTTLEQHRQLSFAHIIRHTKTYQHKTKTAYLLYCAPVSVNEAQSDACGVPAKKMKKNEKVKKRQMLENTKSPLRCPVRLYDFYLSKCAESVRQHNYLFYLHPDDSCGPSSAVWFSSASLDESIMEAMLVRALTVRQTQWEHRRGSDQHQT